MENNKKTGKKDFHAVDFMRQVRAELTDEFLKDKQKYLDYLKKVMGDFRREQRKAFN